MADGTCGVSSGASARAYSSREENACVDEKTRREIEAKKADEARRQKDVEAEARASAHYASGSSCTSAASADAGSCGAGAPTRRAIDLTDRAEVGRALARLQALDAAPSTSPDERGWLKAQEPALRAARARFATNDDAVGARAAAEHRRAAADRKRIDALVRPNETFEKRADIEKEVVRLRALAPAKEDIALRGAVRARVAWLTEH